MSGVCTKITEQYSRRCSAAPPAEGKHEQTFPRLLLCFSTLFFRLRDLRSCHLRSQGSLSGIMRYPPPPFLPQPPDGFSFPHYDPFPRACLNPIYHLILPYCQSVEGFLVWKCQKRTHKVHLKTPLCMFVV